MQNKKVHNSMTALDSATGRRKKYEYFIFSSRIERLKWIRQYQKAHPNVKIKKCYNLAGNKIVLGVEVSWYLD